MSQQRRKRFVPKYDLPGGSELTRPRGSDVRLSIEDTPREVSSSPRTRRVIARLAIDYEGAREFIEMDIDRRGLNLLDFGTVVMANAAHATVDRHEEITTDATTTGASMPEGLEGIIVGGVISDFTSVIEKYGLLQEVKDGALLGYLAIDANDMRSVRAS